jgi:membrane protease YdiL (CAAX protease family)
MNMNSLEKRKTFLGLGILFVVTILFQILLVGLVAQLTMRGIVIPWWLGIVIAEILTIVPGIIYLRARGENITEGIKLRKIRFSTVLKTLLLSVVIYPVYILTNLLSQLLVPNTVAQASGVLLSNGFLPFFLLTVIVAPICEEFLFRGVFMNKLGEIWGVVAAAAVSALLFGLYHLNFNQFCYAFVLGVYFGIVNQASGSIVTSVIVHAFINLVGTSIAYLSNLAAETLGSNLAEASEELRASEGMGNAIMAYTILGIIGIAISIPLIKSVAKGERR